MPDTVSFGDILTDLGATGAASLGDLVTVAGTTVVYVPAVNGTGGSVHAVQPLDAAHGPHICSLCVCSVHHLRNLHALDTR